MFSRGSSSSKTRSAVYSAARYLTHFILYAGYASQLLLTAVLKLEQLFIEMPAVCDDFIILVGNAPQLLRSLLFELSANHFRAAVIPQRNLFKLNKNNFNILVWLFIENIIMRFKYFHLHILSYQNLFSFYSSLFLLVLFVFFLQFIRQNTLQCANKLKFQTFIIVIYSYCAESAFFLFY